MELSQEQKFKFRYRLEQEQAGNSTDVQSKETPKKSLLPDIKFMKQDSPYLYAAAKTGQDIATIPAHFFNQLAFNAPRSITEKMGYQYPSETDNPIAGPAAKIAGVAGLVTSPINKMIGGSIVGGAYKKAALEGAIGGALYSPQDFTDLKARAMQGAVGGVLAPAAVGIAKGASYAAKSAPEAFARFKANLGDAFKSGSKLKQVASEIGNVKTELENIKTNLIPNAKGDFNEALVGQVYKNKESLSKLGSKITSTYGKALDSIEGSMTSKVMQEDVVKLANDALASMSEQELNNSGVGSRLAKIIQKYTPKEGEIQLNPKEFSLRELKNIKNDILGGFTPGRHEENVAKSIFLKNYGKMLEDFGAGGVADLNKEFAPYINEYNRASGIFKTKSDILVQRGVNALKRIATGDATKTNYLDDLNTLSLLENGSGKFKGTGKGSLIGDMSSHVNKLKSLDEQIGKLNNKEQLLGSEQSRLTELRNVRNKILINLSEALGLGGAVTLGIKLSKS